MAVIFCQIVVNTWKKSDICAFDNKNSEISLFVYLNAADSGLDRWDKNIIINVGMFANVGMTTSQPFFCVWTFNLPWKSFIYLKEL